MPETPPTAAQVEAAIGRYESGAGAPARAIAGLSPQQMVSRPVPGTWSIQEIILHLMDSDLIASDRMKRVIAEPRPLIVNYDESAFARALSYHSLDAALACDLFEKNRVMTAAMLRTLAPDAWVRQGVHTVNGLRSLMDLVTGYSEHLEYHLGFVHRKRAMVEGRAAT